MDRLTKLGFKSKAKHTWKQEWDDEQRRIVCKLMSRAHPAFKKGEHRWNSIQWAVNNPPLTDEEQKEKDKRDAIRKKRAECLASPDAREQKKAPPDPGPEPTAEEPTLSPRPRGLEAAAAEPAAAPAAAGRRPSISGGVGAVSTACTVL